MYLALAAFGGRAKISDLPDHLQADVKDFFGNYEKKFKVITKKPIEADKEEQKKNSRSRSAKLRIAEKI